MNLGEASRQYQAALEAARRVRSMLDGMVWADDVLAECETELDAARDALWRAWGEQALGVRA